MGFITTQLSLTLLAAEGWLFLFKSYISCSFGIYRLYRTEDDKSETHP